MFTFISLPPALLGSLAPAGMLALTFRVRNLCDIDRPGPRKLIKRRSVSGIPFAPLNRAVRPLVVLFLLTQPPQNCGLILIKPFCIVPNVYGGCHYYYQYPPAHYGVPLSGLFVVPFLTPILLGDLAPPGVAVPPLRGSFTAFLLLPRAAVAVAICHTLRLRNL